MLLLFILSLLSSLYVFFSEKKTLFLDPSHYYRCHLSRISFSHLLSPSSYLGFSCVFLAEWGHALIGHSESCFALLPALKSPHMIPLHQKMRATNHSPWWSVSFHTHSLRRIRSSRFSFQVIFFIFFSDFLRIHRLRHDNHLASPCDAFSSKWVLFIYGKVCDMRLAFIPFSFSQTLHTAPDVRINYYIHWGMHFKPRMDHTQ